MIWNFFHILLCFEMNLKVFFNLANESKHKETSLLTDYLIGNIAIVLFIKIFKGRF